MATKLTEWVVYTDKESSKGIITGHSSVPLEEKPNSETCISWERGFYEKAEVDKLLEELGYNKNE